VVTEEFPGDPKSLNKYSRELEKAWLIGFVRNPGHGVGKEERSKEVEEEKKGGGKEGREDDKEKRKEYRGKRREKGRMERVYPSYHLNSDNFFEILGKEI
jgi:hypothetical protein